MRHSSSKAAAGAGTAVRLGELALGALAGAVAALLLEAGGIVERVAVLPVAPPLGWLIALTGLLCALHSGAARVRPVLLAAGSGCSLALASLLNYHWHQLDEAQQGRTLVVAEVLSIPERQGDLWRFTAQLHAARADDAHLPASANAPHWPLRVRLRWQRTGPLHVGERWQFIANVETLTSARNPGQGWFGQQQLRAGLHANGSVIDSPLTRRIAGAGNSIDAAREWLSSAIRAQVLERDAAALLVALGVGDTQYVSPEQWRIFNAVGITHLVAISGLHVTLFGTLVAALTRRIWRLCPWLWRRFRREHCAALAAVMGAGGYALLSGFSVPAQRTLVMLATWQLLRCSARPAAVAPALAVAMLCVLALDPLAPLSAGFWLSFVAVAVLMHTTLKQSPAIAEEQPRRSAWLRRAANGVLELWHTQWRVALGLLPVMLAVFGSASMAGLLVNLFAIPLFSFALVPLVLLSLPLLPLDPGLGAVPLSVAACLAQAVQPWLTRIADWPFALWRVQPPAWTVLLAMPAVWLLLLPARWSQRGTALCALLPLCWPRLDTAMQGEFDAVVLDTGRSLALVVRTANHALLYDVGEHWGSDGAVMRAVVMPALRSLRVRALDRVMMPALDNDRGAALTSIAASLPVTTWQAGGRPGALPPEFSPCVGGERWQWDGIHFETLTADCALRISAGPGATLLVSGEVDRVQQQRLVSAGLGASDVVIVPRHGSASAYLASFRDAVVTHWLIVPQSARGAATASVQSTLSAWSDAGAQLWVTGQRGAVSVRGSPRGMHVQAAGR